MRLGKNVAKETKKDAYVANYPAIRAMYGVQRHVGTDVARASYNVVIDRRGHRIPACRCSERSMLANLC